MYIKGWRVQSDDGDVKSQQIAAADLKREMKKKAPASSSTSSLFFFSTIRLDELLFKWMRPEISLDLSCCCWFLYYHLMLFLSFIFTPHVKAIMEHSNEWIPFKLYTSWSVLCVPLGIASFEETYIVIQQGKKSPRMVSQDPLSKGEPTHRIPYIVYSICTFDSFSMKERKGRSPGIVSVITLEQEREKKG